MKILICPFTSSSIAHIIRGFYLADLYVSLGHKVYFTSSISKKSFIESFGYKVLETYNDVNLNDESDQSVNFFKDNIDKFTNWFKTEIDCAKSLQPDLIIMIPGIFGKYIELATGMKTIYITDIQYLPELTGILGMAKSGNSINHKLLRLILRPIFANKFNKQYLQYLNKVYDNLSLPHNFNNTTEFYKDALTLVPSNKYLEPSSLTDDNYLFDISWNGFSKYKLPASELKNIISYSKKLKNKIIFISFGGSVFDEFKYKSIFESLSKLDYIFIVALGPNFEVNEFENYHNIFKYKYVYYNQLVKISSIIITLGGAATVSHIMKAGKAMILIPCNMDQHFYAERVEELGIGININKVPIWKFSKRENFGKIPNNLGERIVNAIYVLDYNKKYSKNVMQFKKLLKSNTQISKLHQKKFMSYFLGS